MSLNPFRRYQKGLSLDDLYPKKEGKCACGCQNLISGKKRKWFSDECRLNSLYHFYIIKGDITFIRKYLFEIENGFCRYCGVYDDEWQADHILPVFMGGGACGIDNFQTLCLHCHKIKNTLNRIPNIPESETSCLNISHSSNNALWTANDLIGDLDSVIDA